jgi:hypothetical protein
MKLKARYNFVPKEKKTTLHLGKYGILFIILSLWFHAGFWLALTYWIIESAYCTYKENQKTK